MLPGEKPYDLHDLAHASYSSTRLDLYSINTDQHNMLQRQDMGCTVDHLDYLDRDLSEVRKVPLRRQLA